MSYKLYTTPLFEREFKILCKKHRSAKADIIAFIKTLEEDPEQGISLGKDCFKIRIAIKSKGKGKSGGARLITRVRIIHESVYLLSIYDKSEKESLSDKELMDLLKDLND
uniref:Addiction module toxin RelE n=1 Tax=Sphingobacterium sp. (strain 21) TaxID=743722 RepID=F4CDB9_SPHS2